MFRPYVDLDLDILDAPAYFRVLLALHPDLIPDEFQSLPKQDERGYDCTTAIRKSILPALALCDDVEFWEQLTEYDLLRIDPRILHATK